MSPLNHRRNWWTILLLLIIVILLLILGIVGRHYHPTSTSHSGGPDSVKADTVHWGRWNILFKDGASDATVQQAAALLEDSLRVLLVQSGIDTFKIHPIFHLYFCPCDRTLANVDLTLINESGTPVTPSSPIAGGGNNSGNGMGGSVINVQYDTVVTIPEYANATPIPPSFVFQQADTSIKSFLRGYTPALISKDLVLAVIDTGLDSLEFKSKDHDNIGAISSLVWKDPSNKPTLYNTLIGADPGQLTDDETSFKHGSSVTYISLLVVTQNPNTQPVYPRIMVLKALDSMGRGSVFTISCAMSYAIQHKASIINASLGYAGSSKDPILEHYFRKADEKKIPVMVAAGNDSTQNHAPTQICSNAINHPDSLSESNLFFPACFSLTMPYVTAVTGINKDYQPCYYQKFSPVYVDLGIQLNSLHWLIRPDPQTCCSFYIPYLNDGSFVEGSSFSTPVASGYFLSALQTAKASNLPAPKPRDWLKGLPEDSILRPYVKSGAYTEYAY